MRTGLLVVAVLALVAIGYFVGKSGRPEPTVIRVESEPAAAFVSGSELDTGTVSGGSLKASGGGPVVIVKDGESIQDAVSAAQPGTVIKVMPGTYKETIYIDKDNITLSGVIEQGRYAVLEGEGLRNDAVLYSGNNVTVENLWITHYKGNGVMGQAGNNFVIRNNVVVDTGVYGIFPQLGKNGVVSHNIVSGIEDAAIYVGMSDNVDVRFNRVFESVAGIEIENSRHALVEGNYVYDNTGGILAFITPGLPIKTCGDVIIRNNFVIDNNHENFAIPGSLVSNIPQGTGILIMACDDVVMEGNLISGNNSVGIAITDFSLAANAANDPDSDPYPNGIKILDNIMLDNGRDPAPAVRAVMLAQLQTQGPDIADTVGMSDGCINHRERFRVVGLDNYSHCNIDTTASVATLTTAEHVPRRSMDDMDKGKLAYYGICAGCHAYNSRLIGPPVVELQSIYKDNPRAMAEFIRRPFKRRDDYPEMPPQGHLDEETRIAAARFLLGVSN